MGSKTEKGGGGGYSNAGSYPNAPKMAKWAMWAGLQTGKIVKWEIPVARGHTDKMGQLEKPLGTLKW